MLSKVMTRKLFSCSVQVEPKSVSKSPKSVSMEPKSVSSKAPRTVSSEALKSVSSEPKSVSISWNCCRNQKACHRIPKALQMDPKSVSLYFAQPFKFLTSQGLLEEELYAENTSFIVLARRENAWMTGLLSVSKRSWNDVYPKASFSLVLVLCQQNQREGFIVNVRFLTSVNSLNVPHYLTSKHVGVPVVRRQFMS